MAKKLISKRELEKLLLTRLRELLPDVGANASVGMYHILESGLPNWDVSVMNFDGADPQHAAFVLSTSIKPELMRIYDVDWES